jgi:hypothetical protein
MTFPGLDPGTIVTWADDSASYALIASGKRIAILLAW